MREALRQILALDELHHERLAARGVFQPVNGRDVRVIQRGEESSLPLEPRDPVRIGRERLGEDLDGNVAIEPRVPRPIHFPHAAGPERGVNLVRADAGAGG